MAALSSSPVPFAREDFGGRAGHVDIVVRFAPLDLQIAAGEVDQRAALRPAGDGGGDEDGAGAGAAGPGDAAAALPAPHLQLARRNHLRPMRVDPLGKRRMTLGQRADAVQVELIDVRHKRDRVGIASGNGNDLYRLAAELVAEDVSAFSRLSLARVEWNSRVI